MTDLFRDILSLVAVAIGAVLAMGITYNEVFKTKSKLFVLYDTKRRVYTDIYRMTGLLLFCLILLSVGVDYPKHSLTFAIEGVFLFLWFDLRMDWTWFDHTHNSKRDVNKRAENSGDPSRS